MLDMPALMRPDIDDDEVMRGNFPKKTMIGDFEELLVVRNAYAVVQDMHRARDGQSITHRSDPVRLLVTEPKS